MDRIIIFGAGDIGEVAVRMFQYDKDILCIIDNDNNKWGKKLFGVEIMPPEEGLSKFDYDYVVIAVLKYSQIVLQLEKLGVHCYKFYEDVYYDCQESKSCFDILSKNVPDSIEGRYTGKHIRDSWMNHLTHMYSSRVRQNLPQPLSKSILDVGCGCGTWLFHALLLGYDAYGVDCCDWKLLFCQTKVDDFHFPPSWKKRFVFGYGEDLPFEDNYFDIVTCWYVLEHVHDYEKCLDEMIRICKHGGIIYINAPDYSNSYEEHYGVDIGKPIKDNFGLLKSTLEQMGKDTDLLLSLNLITAQDVIDYLKKKKGITIVDNSEKSPSVIREKGSLIYRRCIDLTIYVE